MRQLCLDPFQLSLVDLTKYHKEEVFLLFYDLKIQL